MITKLLRRFCSEEVRLMLTHLEEHPKDFELSANSKWPILFGSLGQDGTFIEQIVASNVRRKAFKRMRREQFKQDIVKQTIAPEEKDSYRELMQLSSVAPGSFVTTSHNSILQQIQHRQGLRNAQQAMNAQQSMANQMGHGQAHLMYPKDTQ